MPTIIKGYAPAVAPGQNIHPANAGREYFIKDNDHGIVLPLGNASDGRVGTFVLQFVPDQSWLGGMQVVARIYGKPASDNGVAYQTIPYRRVALNGVASDRALVSDTLTGAFIIEVPSNGLAIGVIPAVTAGFGVLYNWPLNGPAT